MPHQKNGNMYAHKNFGLEATFVGLVATTKQNQTRLIAYVDISNKKNRTMSKAKDKAKEYAEKFILTVDHQGDVEEAYIDDYHQAEKDLELGWEDIKTIDKLMNQCVDCSNPYQEVLKRFNGKRKK